MPEIIASLDIGTTKVCALIAERDIQGRPDIIGIGMVPCAGLRRGVVVDIPETVTAIEKAVEQAQRMAGMTIDLVCVGVTGEHIASLNARGVIAITHSDRMVTNEDVLRVLENSQTVVLPPDREIVHAIPRGYAVDGQSGVKNPVGMSGTRLEVETHVVTGASMFLRNVRTCVERAGLEDEYLVLEPLATGRAVLLPAERELGVALLDIGGGTSDLAIFRGGEVCYSSVVPSGGMVVTRDIAAGLRSSEEEAERVKCTYGHTQLEAIPEGAIFTYTPLGSGGLTERPLFDLVDMIEARVSEQLERVRDELRRSKLEEKLPAGLVLSGGGALLPGVETLAEKITGLPTRLGNPMGVGGVPTPMQDPIYATAVGLLLWSSTQHGRRDASLQTGNNLWETVQQWWIGGRGTGRRKK
jgi:cell division protein FtsA